MLLLTSTSDLLQVVTGSAVNMDVRADWVDLSGSTVTPSRTNTPQITTATTTTVVGSPASSTQRNVQGFSIRNTDAANSNAVTVQHYDGTTTVTIIKYTLLAGEVLFYQNNEWYVIDASGGVKNSPSAGRLLKVSVLTSGTTFTSQMSTTSIRVKMVGGGGGGAGCTSVATAASYGGGGGGGSYAEKLYTGQVGNKTYTISIGSLGAGASGALGGTGGNTTFTDGTTLVTANGGIGAPVATASASLTAYAGGAGGAVSTNGDLNSGGMPGEFGVSLVPATPTGVSGKGGDSQYGSGGVGKTAVGNGNSALGFGAGGGGAATGASTVRTGGSGTAGCIVVEEYA